MCVYVCVSANPQSQRLVEGVRPNSHKPGKPRPQQGLTVHKDEVEKRGKLYICINFKSFLLE